MDASRVQINRLNIGLNKLHMTKNTAEGVHNVARIKIACCDLVQHWRKENEILVTDQRHLYVRSTREAFVEVHCRVKPGEPATGNDYSSRFHGNPRSRSAGCPSEASAKEGLFPIFFSSFSVSKF
jgi:hypothetical protein